MTRAAKVIQQLLQIKAIKLNPQNPFTWASGIQSPIYCDNRILLSYPASRKIIIDAFKEQASAFGDFDVVAGVATAGIPHGALLAAALNKPFVYVRSKAKEHGRQNLIEGYLRGNERILVIEDLISTGGSCLRAVEALRTVGCKVVGAIAIFSYGFERAKKAFAEADCPFSTLTNYDVLLEEAVKIGYIKPEDLATLQKWRQDPQNWLQVQ